MFNKEALVIGLGISGCAAARMLADAGYNVTCFEKESHIGGYLFEETRPNGIRVQSCGPHIFHTDNESVYAFLRRFGSFYPYTHRVLAQVDKKLVPLPLNRHSLEMLFGEERTALLLARIHAFWSDRKRIAVDELINSKDSHLADLGRYIVENILTININRKSSGSFAYADDSYMNDAYVDITEDDNYYEDSIQAMPMQGFMKVMEKMIDHPAITTYLNMDGLTRISLLEESGVVLFDGAPFKGPVVYTPTIDKLFDYRFGDLRFRGNIITFQDLDSDFSNPCAVIVRPGDPESVRVYESKQMTLQDLPGKTTVCMEAPYVSAVKGVYEPFEPDLSSESMELYRKYHKLSRQFPSLALLGRMACYENQSISESIEQVMEFVSRL